MEVKTSLAEDSSQRTATLLSELTLKSLLTFNKPAFWLRLPTLQFSTALKPRANAIVLPTATERGNTEAQSKTSRRKRCRGSSGTESISSSFRSGNAGLQAEVWRLPATRPSWGTVLRRRTRTASSPTPGPPPTVLTATLPPSKMAAKRELLLPYPKWPPFVASSRPAFCPKVKWPPERQVTVGVRAHSLIT
ncbi:uncharacterized protein [Excalfactoria chinensis]|uniref:uncharacterized protein isoform X1 n=1 Tax=Excalfactoria chinensis TaxID=46218 RepID=UPI003B3B66B6